MFGCFGREVLVEHSGDYPFPRKGLLHKVQFVCSDLDFVSLWILYKTKEKTMKSVLQSM